LYQKGRIQHRVTFYQEQSQLCKKNFNERFWYANGNYLYDVVDGPDGDDISLRPNQLLAFSLRYPVLDQNHRRRVLDLITRKLVTPFGLRTLAQKDPAYHGQLEANFEARQRAKHQGCVWPWLLGPYVDALICVERSARPTKNSRDNLTHPEQFLQKGLDLLASFQQHLHEGMLGVIGSVFDGNFPHATRCIGASATSTGELLRIYNRLAYLSIEDQNQVLTL
jgi:glycogen debranching enzyme